MSVLLIMILWLSSLFHLTLGCGEPVALQVSVSLAPSRTITSLLLSESSIFGGTETKTKRKNLINFSYIVVNVSL